MKRILAALVIAAFGCCGSATAQTSPNWSFGTVPTPAQWNALFASKQDYLGSSACLTAGCTMTGLLTAAPSTTAGAGINVAPGVAPTSPNNGDIWVTSAGSFVRVNGITETFGSACATCALTNAANVFTAVQEINLNATSLQAPLASTVLQVGNADGTATRVEVDSFAATAYFSGSRADGTAASPTALQSGDQITGYNAFGYDGTTFAGPQATFRCFASQNWFHAAALGTYCEVAVTPNNATSEASTIRFENDGGITVPSTVAGGDEGAGAINASALYQAGVQVAAHNATLTLGSSTLTLGGTTTTVAGLTLTSPIVGTGMTLSFATGGGAQCLHVNNTGVVSATGADCGSGGTGLPGGSSGQFQWNSGGVFAGATGVTTAGTGITVASGDLTLSGSSSGSSVLNAPATGGGTATLPAGAGTLVYSNVATLSSLTSIGTIATGVWHGTAIAPAYGGTGQNTSSSTGVPQVAAGTWSVSTTLPSSLTAPSFTVTGAFTATGLVTNADLASSTITLGSTAMSLGSTYTTIAGSLTLSGTVNLSGTVEVGGSTMTFPGSPATLAALNLADQTLTGGANVTSDNLGTVTSGTTTIDCGARPLQYLTNGGAFTMAAPANDGSCAVQITNNGSAGAVTFSGFTVNASYIGAIPDTTNGHKFVVFIARANGSAIYNVIPQQ